MKVRYYLAVMILLICSNGAAYSQSSNKSNYNIIAYYSGDSNGIDGFNVKNLTHIIYSFCHLKGNKLAIDNAKDSATIKKLVGLKANHPKLKIIVALGGWGGCKTCSPVFANEAGRLEFATSVKELCNSFNIDGIDIDWEYPTIPGYPDHPYSNDDKKNFTFLMQALRNSLGADKEISFAAGGFTTFLQDAVDWKAVMPLVNHVNIMSYDLVGGGSTVTGHHTALYSSAQQKESADNAVQYLDSLGIPMRQIVIGAAFYARTWEQVANKNNGLHQQGKFQSFIPYRQFNKRLSRADGFTFYYDDKTKSPYAYNAKENVFATFDDETSIKEKTKYMMSKGLGGIMFWELSLDKKENGLLDQIHKTVNNK